MLTREELVELLGTDQTRFFHDNFKTVDHISQSTTQTGYINPSMHNLRLETGIQSGSAARIYYTNPIYNPKYSILQMKVRISSMNDVIAFFGFYPSTEPPTVPAVENYAGFYLVGGVLYSYTGNNVSISKTALSNIDLTNHWLLKIEFDKFSTRPLPIVYPYFDGIRIERPSRQWAVAAQHGYCQPEDQYYYLVAQIQNTTGADKVLEIGHITYSEEYAD